MSDNERQGDSEDWLTEECLEIQQVAELIQLSAQISCEKRFSAGEPYATASVRYSGTDALWILDEHTRSTKEAEYYRLTLYTPGGVEVLTQEYSVCFTDSASASTAKVLCFSFVIPRGHELQPAVVPFARVLDPEHTT